TTSRPVQANRPSVGTSSSQPVSQATPTRPPSKTAPSTNASRRRNQSGRIAAPYQESPRRESRACVRGLIAHSSIAHKRVANTGGTRYNNGVSSLPEDRLMPRTSWPTVLALLLLGPAGARADDPPRLRDALALEEAMQDAIKAAEPSVACVL